MADIDCLEPGKRFCVTKADLVKGIFAVTLFIRAGYIASRSEGYRLIKQGGLYINSKQLHDRAYKVTLDDVIDGRIEVRVGRWKKMREFRVIDSAEVGYDILTWV